MLDGNSDFIDFAIWHISFGKKILGNLRSNSPARMGKSSNITEKLRSILGFQANLSRKTHG